MQPIDWVVVIGGPLLFISIAWFGLQAIIGPPAEVNPVQRLRAGAVSVGMSERAVIQAVGKPKAILDKESGGYYFRYEGSAWDNQAKAFALENSYVDFNESGRVTGVSFEVRTPPPSAENSS
jgi:hypothetical protein